MKCSGVINYTQVFAALAILESWGCTFEIKTPPPEVHVDCVEVVLPGGQVTVACPDGGVMDDATPEGSAAISSADVGAPNYGGGLGGPVKSAGKLQ